MEPWYIAVKFIIKQELLNKKVVNAITIVYVFVLVVCSTGVRFFELKMSTAALGSNY